MSFQRAHRKKLSFQYSDFALNGVENMTFIKCQNPLFLRVCFYVIGSRHPVTAMVKGNDFVWFVPRFIFMCSFGLQMSESVTAKMNLI